MNNVLLSGLRSRFDTVYRHTGLKIGNSLTEQAITRNILQNSPDGTANDMKSKCVSTGFC